MKKLLTVLLTIIIVFLSAFILDEIFAAMSMASTALVCLGVSGLCLLIIAWYVYYQFVIKKVFFEDDKLKEKNTKDEII